MNARLGFGGSYSLRNASAVGELEHVTFHGVRAEVDYHLTQVWRVSGGAGFDYVPATLITPAQHAPGFSGMADWEGRSRCFHAGYQKMFVPSFGFGGAVEAQDVSVSHRMPLFSKRRLYTEESLSWRDNKPLLMTPGLLRLRTTRIRAAVGYAPRPWIRVEGFYSKAFQTTFIPGGDIDRNRIGFQITTSSP